MREIKFRAWSPSRKVMGKPFNPFPVMGGVFPKDEILMQYTGLKDKTAKEIYEGDIVRDKLRQICSIKWFDIACSFGYKHYGNFLPNPFDSECEVIGNIYETPELLMKG